MGVCIKQVSIEQGLTLIFDLFNYTCYIFYV